MHSAFIKDDLAERSEQVSKMRTIYERAEEVLVWLGSSIGEAPLAFDLCEDLYRNRDSNKDIERILGDPSNLQNLQALIHPFRRPYWMRLWVIQEINSAKKLEILCGRCKINWSNAVAVQNVLHLYHRKLVSQLLTEEPGLLDLGFAILFQGPQSLELSQYNGSLALPSLYSLLCKFWKQGTSDPKDRIYALVGLSSTRNDPRFAIDYLSPSSQVYTDTAKYLLLSSQRLDVICSMPRRESTLSLPSWVSDWTNDTTRYGLPLVSLIGTEWVSYRASATSIAEISFKHADHILTANGLRLGHVRSVGKKENLESHLDLRSGIPILLSWFSLCNVTKAPTSVLVDAFCRSINFDYFTSSDFACSAPLELTEKILAGIVVLAEEVCPEKKIDQLLAALRAKYDDVSIRWAKSWMISVFTVVKRRRLFISGSGLIGLGPEKVEVRDIICILLGCSVPVILRPQDDHYIFLGEACVPGYMQGKAMEELAKGKFQLESFKIH
jgi:hypothetical protein